MKNQQLPHNANSRLALIIAIAAIILSLPLIAMQFTEAVVWTGTDFIAAGVLLFGSGLLLELILRKFSTRAAKLIACSVLFIMLFLIWAELAVGIFGTPLAGS